MKKLAMIVLAMLMMLSLCACGENEASSNRGFFSSWPTKKEKEDIQLYVDILKALDNYLTDGTIVVLDAESQNEIEGGQALEYCYKTIQGLENVDTWIGTKHISDIRTREEILESFTVIPDVRLHDKAVTLDSSGKVTYELGSGFYTYNAEGQITEGYLSILDQYFLDDSLDVSLGFALRKYFHYNMEYTCAYGATGDIGVVENKANRITFNYSGDRVTSVECLDAEYSKKTIYSLHYDKQDRLSKAEGVIYERQNEKTIDTYNFIYDDNNTLIREEYVRAFFEGDKEPLSIEEWCTDYKYHSDGKLSSATVSYKNGGELQLTVDYAKNGKLVTYHFKHLDKDGNISGMEKKESTYGDAYIYNPKK